MKLPTDYEYDCQVAIFEWASIHQHYWPCLFLLYGSLMGVSLPRRLLNKAIKAGMKKGKPDINLPVPLGGFCGLWIELKRERGRGPTPEQHTMLTRLYEVGNASFVCKGRHSAIRVIENYLKGKIVRMEPPYCATWDATQKFKEVA